MDAGGRAVVVVTLNLVSFTFHFSKMNLMHMFLHSLCSQTSQSNCLLHLWPNVTPPDQEPLICFRRKSSARRSWQCRPVKGPQAAVPGVRLGESRGRKGWAVWARDSPGRVGGEGGTEEFHEKEPRAPGEACHVHNHSVSGSAASFGFVFRGFFFFFLVSCLNV